jgi:hypothetical protein
MVIDNFNVLTANQKHFWKRRKLRVLCWCSLLCTSSVRTHYITCSATVAVRSPTSPYGGWGSNLPALSRELASFVSSLSLSHSLARSHWAITLQTGNIHSLSAPFRYSPTQTYRPLSTLSTNIICSQDPVTPAKHPRLWFKKLLTRHCVSRNDKNITTALA